MALFDSDVSGVTPRRGDAGRGLRRLAFEHASDAMLIVDAVGERIVMANSSAGRMLGYSQDEMHGLPVKAIHPDEMARLRAFVREAETQGLSWTDELACVHKNGGRLPAEIAVSSLPRPGRPHLLAVVRQRETPVVAGILADDGGDCTARFGEQSLDIAPLERHRMVGGSAALESIGARIDRVAPTDATVLVTGESGTGKELIARAVHRASRRASAPFVRVNCAALPVALFESELFGHVRGEFTGATTDRAGLLGQADGGTLLLDEVGEMPLEAQAKLLRVLQDGEYRRVGGTRARRADVRIIAATNCDLDAAVVQGRVRLDLLYRLGVYPIHVPALRDRREDIGPITRELVRGLRRQLARPDLRLDESMVARLTAHAWPGNARELENVLRRAAIDSLDGSLRPETGADSPALAASPPATQSARPLEPCDTRAARIVTECERRALDLDSLLAALAATGGKVSGPCGAARLLGLPPSTLTSRLRAHGIRCPRAAIDVYPD